MPRMWAFYMQGYVQIPTPSLRWMHKLLHHLLQARASSLETMYNEFFNNIQFSGLAAMMICQTCLISSQNLTTPVSSRYKSTLPPTTIKWWELDHNCHPNYSLIFCPLWRPRAREFPILLIAPTERDNRDTSAGIGEVGAATRQANRQSDKVVRPLSGSEQRRSGGQLTIGSISTPDVFPADDVHNVDGSFFAFAWHLVEDRCIGFALFSIACSGLRYASQEKWMDMELKKPQNQWMVREADTE